MSFQTTLPINDMDSWLFSAPPDFQPDQDTYLDDMAVFGEPDVFSDDTEASSSSSLLNTIASPPFIQPHDLHVFPTRTSSSSPDPSPSSSQFPHFRADPNDSTASHLPQGHQRPHRRLSTTSTNDSPGNETYRPRHTPTKPRKSKPGRITPRSEKHARELELNRKAATKCRNRQKAYVEDLQARCRQEEAKMQAQTSLVHALMDEVMALRGEAMRQSFCACRLP